MRLARMLQAVDAHAAGEPGRVIVGGVLDELGGFGEYRVMVLPDHPTPIPVRTHTREPVPFAIYSSIKRADYVDRFDEFATKEGIFGQVDGHRLMGLLIE